MNHHLVDVDAEERGLKCFIRSPLLWRQREIEAR
jgi:hypothetical protein